MGPEELLRILAALGQAELFPQPQGTAGSADHGETATVLETYKNAKLYNLYLDPKERYSFFSRAHFHGQPVQRSLAGEATFEEYPGKKAMIRTRDRGVPDW